jgi:ribosomal silencing factor RsfS
MKEAYIVKKITYYIDRDVVEKNTDSDTFDISKFDLTEALFKSESDMQVIAVCDSLQNVKSLIKKVTEPILYFSIISFKNNIISELI